jgi:5-methylcytosine-specific restriction endonuclease McrA
MDMKVCSKCGIEKPATLEYFAKKERGKYGLRGNCRECDNIRHKIYRENNEQYFKDYMSKWKNNNPKYFKEWGQSNREKIYNRLKSTNYYEMYYKENKDKINELRRINYNTNPGKRNIYCNKRRSIIKSLPATLTAEQWIECKSHFENKCAYCGRTMQRLEQEHFIALTMGGEYTKNNIIPACRSCNSSKHNRDFYEWYPKQKFYSPEREKQILSYLGYKDGVQQLSISI